MSDARPPSVAIVQRSLRRYRVPFYEQLRKELEGQGIGLRLIHNDPPVEQDVRGDHGHVAWAEHRPLRGGMPSSNRPLWQPCLDLLRDSDLLVLEQASRLLYNYVALAAQRIRGPRVGLWGHGMDHRPANTAPTAQRVKTRMARLPHWWFAYTEEAGQAVAGLGFPPDRITVVRNATDTRGLSALVDAVTPSEVTSLRAELGVESPHVAAFVGNLQQSKDLPFLLEAAHHLRAQVPDFELLILGEGKQNVIAGAAAAEYPWIHHVGFRSGRPFATALRLAQALLVPSWAGLVVVDSFAAGTPLVASASAAHPPEIAYLRDGVNGLLVDDRGDAATYAAAAATLLTDETRRLELAAGCRASALEYSVEDMATRFASGVARALQH